MASEPLKPASSAQPVLRLAGQLQSLSELTESLAFRVLELEERLAAQDLRLQSWMQADAQAAGPAADTELRLDDTEERLARLESLLSGLEGPGAARQGAGVTALHQAASPLAGEGFLAGDPPPEELFYEEEEQPFMDEQLSA